jgi:uncharacterized caspase-like protein
MLSRTAPFARIAFLALSIAAGLACWATGSKAQEPLRGVALVIGQSAYESLPGLANPANDARAIDRLLSDLGFSVDAVLDGNARRLARAFERFVEDAAEADVALVYYSGHGVEAGGENFLVPVDAGAPAAGGTVGDLVPVSGFLEDLRHVAPIVIVLLDACRDNPYPAGTVLATGEGGSAMIGGAGLGAPRGATSLVRVEGSETLGAVIGFAASPGRAALDGPAGGHSPYAAALLKHIAAGGYDFGDVMTMVAEEVYLETDTRQLPWTNASLRRLLYFGLDAEPAEGDEQAIRDGRRSLLLTIATTPPTVRVLVEQVATANGVPLDSLYGMLDVLGVDAASGDLEAQLAAGAARLRSILEARDAQERQDPEIVRLAALADDAEDEGAMALALTFRDRASQRADTIEVALDEAEANIADRRRELAATYRSNAETAALNFDFASAARRYGDAYEQAKAIDVPLAYQFKVLQGEMLNDHGVYAGDSQALVDSLAAYDLALEIGRAGPDARRDAALKGNKAIVLTQLGSRTGDMAWLEEAIRLYGEVLEALPRDRYPEDWAYAQLNLGGLHQALADRGGGSDRFDLALEAYQGAARVLTREAAPGEWAGLQVNIGIVYAQMADRGSGTDAFRKSIAAIEAALTVWTRDGEPVNWALAMSNLATSLRALGAAEGDAAMLGRAVDAHLAALEVNSRERQPTSWAGDMNNLGSTLLELAELEGDISLYEEAVNAYREARTVFTRQASPTSYVTTLVNEARALLALGRRHQDAPFLRQAVAVLDPALEVMREQDNPVGFARARSVQGEFYAEIGRMAHERAALLAAREAFDEARTLFRRSGMGETGQGFWEKQIAAIDEQLAQ